MLHATQKYHWTTTLTNACLIHVPVIKEVTANVFVLLWQLMLKLAITEEYQLNGDLKNYVVSIKKLFCQQIFEHLITAMQCDERCSNYSPCISTCPLETCDNLLTQNKLTKSCSEDTCVEGCSFKLCPPGYVYSNSSHLECVPRSTCKPICLEENGVTYYEGTIFVF